jgi:hypothetical protein
MRPGLERKSLLQVAEQCACSSLVPEAHNTALTVYSLMGINNAC